MQRLPIHNPSGAGGLVITFGTQARICGGAGSRAGVCVCVCVFVFVCVCVRACACLLRTSSADERRIDVQIQPYGINLEPVRQPQIFAPQKFKVRG